LGSASTTAAAAAAPAIPYREMRKSDWQKSLRAIFLRVKTILPSEVGLALENFFTAALSNIAWCDFAYHKHSDWR